MTENSGRFTSERMKGNQFAKGNKPNKTTYRKGKKHTGKQHPSWKGGVQKNTKDCTYLHSGNNKRVRRPRAIWESEHGALPKGYVIHHIDGNRNNDKIENLEAISRGELLKRNIIS